MLNNFINIHDFHDLLNKGFKILPKLTSNLLSGHQRRVKAAWEHTTNPPTNWWDIPAVRMRWNNLVSGDSSVDYYEYISNGYFNDRHSLRALSLGCGTGHNELVWAEKGKFDSISAYDLSEQRITTAREMSIERKLSNIIDYRVGDVFGIELQENGYDVVLFEQSLHHFSPLDKILNRVGNVLKRDGYLIINEYAGPTRFQWTNRQLEAVNGLLSVLPLKYKRLWQSKNIKHKVIKPSRLRMLVNDPSEAIESERIRPLLQEKFEVIEMKEYGGSILHLLFNGIAHNFLSDDNETLSYLDIIFRAEDLLMASQDIQSDFIVAICKKKSN